LLLNLTVFWKHSSIQSVIQRHSGLFSGNLTFVLTKLMKLSFPRILKLLSAGVFAACTLYSSAANANLIQNGSFEEWAMTSGNQGVPVGWSKALGKSTGDLVRTASIGNGDTEYAAVILNNTVLSAPLEANNGVLELGFVFAATNPDNGGNRSFNLILTQSEQPTTGSGGLINIRASTSTTDASTLRLMAFDGSDWRVIADGLPASVYNVESNSFTSLNAYRFVLSLDLAGADPSYSISYGPIGGELITVNNIQYFWTAPVAGSVTYLMFNGNSSATPYAIGEVYAIPEASHTVTVLGLFLAAVLFAKKQ